MYKLSRVIHAHKRDARCLDYHEGVLASGGNDSLFHLYSYTHAPPLSLTASTLPDSEVLSLKLNRTRNSHFLIIGCKNGDIFSFDHQGNPIAKFAHTSPICSLDFIDSDRIVSGSWDGKATVWSLGAQKPLAEYTQHKYAVCVFYSKSNNWVVSGSQDKALNLWDFKTGGKIKRVENAHNDIIREIADI